MPLVRAARVIYILGCFDLGSFTTNNEEVVSLAEIGLPFSLARLRPRARVIQSSNQTKWMPFVVSCYCGSKARSY